MQAIIFDFNGTLFSDTDLHEKAWRQFLRGVLQRDLAADEFDQIHGRSNHLIMENLLGKKLTKAEGQQYSEQKEMIYRQLILENKRFDLIAGAKDFFGQLKNSQIPINIATAAPKSNVDFYFELFQLQQWFDLDKIVFNDGQLASKPAPDYYQKAALNIGADPKQMVVFEDSPIGIQGAANAKARKIIAVATNNNHEILQNNAYVDLVIDDFTDPGLQVLL
ncbi:MAG TPA: HAD family phosphatase [Tetragenococcus sp.]|nr:HAD family phosphatase [Tetragenococcus sp.]